MFKLIKIMNGRTNVPEPVKMKTSGQVDYLAGCVYYLAQNDVHTTPVSENDLMFIPLENAYKSDGKKHVTGYIVTEGMVFETEIRNDYTMVGVGDTVCLFTNSSGQIVCVEAIYGEEAKILNMDTTADNGKVLVALKW